MLSLLVLAVATTGSATEPAAPARPASAGCEGNVCSGLSAADVLRIAADLATRDVRQAQRMLVPVLKDRDPAARAEARFRLAQLAERAGDLPSAERWYRALLDEKPDAAMARLELGRVLAQQSKTLAAARELRRAHAGGLPPELARTVEKITSLLRSDAPFGGSFELALAPDSNINGATDSKTVTAFGLPFTLDETARGRSGVGVAYAGQVFVRRPLGDHRFTLALNTQGTRYRDKDASDLSVSLSAGPQFRFGRLQLSTALTAGRGWLGGERLTASYGLDAKARMPLGTTSALAVNAAAVLEDNHRSPDASGTALTAQVALEKALSARLYGRLNASVARNDAKAGTLSSWSYGSGFTLSRQLGALTGYAGVEARWLRGDEPFFLFGRARNDTLVQGTLGLVVRPLTIGGFAPVVRVSHARNNSPIEIYGYRRTRAEFGITRDF